MARPGLKGFDHREVANYIVRLLEAQSDKELSTLQIFDCCNMKFRTTDSQIRSLLIYMVRDKQVLITDRWSYRLVPSGKAKVYDTPTNKPSEINWFEWYLLNHTEELSDDD